MPYKQQLIKNPPKKIAAPQLDINVQSVVCVGNLNM